MVDIICLDGCEYSEKDGEYGGLSGDKEGIIFNDCNWIVKYPKNIRVYEGTGGASYSTSPLSEFIGSHIYSILGYPVHDTFLGLKDDKIVVACKDFTDKNNILMEIRTVKNRTNKDLRELLEQNISSTGSSHIVDLDEMLLHLKYNPILSGVDGVKERFWEQAVIDIFIQNNDRNNGN